MPWAPLKVSWSDKTNFCNLSHHPFDIKPPLKWPAAHIKDKKVGTAAKGSHHIFTFKDIVGHQNYHISFQPASPTFVDFCLKNQIWYFLGWKSTEIYSYPCLIWIDKEKTPSQDHLFSAKKNDFRAEAHYRRKVFCHLTFAFRTYECVGKRP